MTRRKKTLASPRKDATQKNENGNLLVLHV
jgi:hypothetical protein